jgi:hypothetical protein
MAARNRTDHGRRNRVSEIMGTRWQRQLHPGHAAQIGGTGMSTEPQPGLIPEHLRISYQRSAVMVTVDGQDFRVCERAQQPGTYDFDWLNGPNEYGFGISRSADCPMSLPEMKDTIRGFLAGIDPVTGYLAE